MKNKNVRHYSRRNFIGTVGAAAGAFTIVPRNVMAGRGHRQPSDTVNVAGIGVGAQGAGDISNICSPEVEVSRPARTNSGQPMTAAQIAEQQARRARMSGGTAPGGAPGGAPGAPGAAPGAAPGGAPGAPGQQGAPAGMTGMPGMGGQAAKRNLANIYALCDVDSDYAGYVFKRYPRAKIYSDWRIMLEKEKSIDAVVIATTDHNHAPIAAAYMKEKKHVDVEKPMCKTVFECRKLAELARQYNVVTQMGNQGHASEGTRRVVEWIRAGVIGNVREVHIWTDRPAGWWPQGDVQRPAPVKVPKNLNYDVWIGPAPYKGYHPETTHFNWRGLWDYGTGAMGDMGAHIFDAPVWALDLKYPTSVQATSSPYNTEYLPLSEMVTYEFPERYSTETGYMPPVTVKWFDGGLKAPRPKGLEDGRQVGGAVYYGDKGILMGGNGQNPSLVPNDPGVTGPEPWLERTGDIFEDWIDAIRNGKKSSNDFSHAAKVTEIMLLTNIAVLTQNSNVTLLYDGPNMKMTNLEAANSHFHYEYRQGWSL